MVLRDLRRRGSCPLLSPRFLFREGFLGAFVHLSENYLASGGRQETSTFTSFFLFLFSLRRNSSRATQSAAVCRVHTHIHLNETSTYRPEKADPASGTQLHLKKQESLLSLGHSPAFMTHLPLLFQKARHRNGFMGPVQRSLSKQC